MTLAALRVPACSIALAALASCGGDQVSSPTSPRAGCLERAVFGDPAQSPYLLPYPVGASYEILQGYCEGGHLRYEQMDYDFLIPVGAQIVAARAGVVGHVENSYQDTDSTVGHFNWVGIEHEDGSWALYAHLQHDGLAVRLGDPVSAGQPLARSGSTGASIEHLHFGVYPRWPLVDRESLPVNFRNAGGPLDDRGGLRSGTFYTALPYRG